MSEWPVPRVPVIVIARRAPGQELIQALGEARADQLADLQFARAHAWARTAFSTESVTTGLGGLADVIDDPDLIPGPDDVLVVVAAELAAWRPDLGSAALDDLRAGCALSIAPIFDGGLYLLAATGMGIDLLRGESDGDAGHGGVDLTGPAAMATFVGLAERAGIEVGLLRTERGLRSPGDVRALLADPLCDEELRKLLQ